MNSTAPTTAKDPKPKTLAAQVAEQDEVRHHLRAAVSQLANDQIVTSLRIMTHAAVISGAIKAEDVGEAMAHCPFCEDA